MNAGPDDARRAAALRANLQRRKAQQRGRDAAPGTSCDSPNRSPAAPGPATSTRLDEPDPPGDA